MRLAETFPGYGGWIWLSTTEYGFIDCCLYYCQANFTLPGTTHSLTHKHTFSYIVHTYTTHIMCLSIKFNFLRITPYHCITWICINKHTQMCIKHRIIQSAASWYIRTSFYTLHSQKYSIFLLTLFTCTYYLTYNITVHRWWPQKYTQQAEFYITTNEY